jgi:hypothetical protein
MAICQNQEYLIPMVLKKQFEKREIATTTNPPVSLWVISGKLLVV